MAAMTQLTSVCLFFTLLALLSTQSAAVSIDMETDGVVYHQWHHNYSTTDFYWIFSHYSFIPYLTDDEPSAYYQNNVDATLQVNTGRHKFIRFTIKDYRFYEDVERSCSVSFAACDYINVTGLHFEGSNFPYAYVDNSTDTISLYGSHMNIRDREWHFNASVIDTSFTFQLITDDFGRSKGLEVHYRIESDHVIPDPTLRLVERAVARPKHVGIVMVIICILLLAGAAAVVLVMYRENIKKIISNRKIASQRKREGKEKSVNHSGFDSAVSKFPDIKITAASRVTVRDIEEGEDSEEDDSDFLDIPDETMNYDLCGSDRGPDDSLSYSSHRSDIISDLDSVQADNDRISQNLHNM